MVKRAFSWSILGVGVVVGIIFWGGFNTFMEYTNSYEFCTSCHEMNVVKGEYEQSAHAHNPSGVPAICSAVILPGRKTTALELRKATMVDSMPTGQSPPSRM